MSIMQSAQAGAAEKNDALVTIEPIEAGSGIKIQVHSPVAAEFGRHIKETVLTVLAEYKVTNALVTVQDRGAMDFTIRARTETAVRRSFK